MADTETAQARLGRTFRWTERAFFAAVVIVAVVVVTLGWWSNRVRHQRRIVAEVARYDARIQYDHELRGEAGPPGPRWVRALLGDDFFATVAGVEIVADRVTDETVAAVSALPHLKSLSLNAEGIDDLTLGRLALAGDLEQLTLHSTIVTDAGLAQLAVLRRLTSLHLVAPRMTDLGLIPLEELRGLTSIHLISTDVTPEGIARLREALPDCDVRVSPAATATL